MRCVWFLFKDRVTLIIVDCVFVFPCIRNKILNFHKCGMNTGILEPLSKLHLCEKIQLISEPLGKSMSNLGSL